MLDFVTRQQALAETYALNETLYCVYAPSRFDHRKLGDLISDAYNREEAIEAAKEYFATIAYEEGSRGPHSGDAYLVTNKGRIETVQLISIEYECGAA